MQSGKLELKGLRKGRQIEDRSHCGFTLTELLVVLFTLAILTVMLLPALAGTQPRSKAYQCLNNMRQLALAVDAICW